MTTKIVLVDIDNTLYDWPGFFAPSFRAMVYALVRELKLPEEQLYSEFKAVFAQRGSLEYAFAIQELESVRARGTDEIRRLIRTGRGAFRSVQRHRLQPYPGVRETLQWLLDQNVAVVGVTNSSIYRAQHRLWQLRLDSLLTGLVAWEGFAPEQDEANTGYVPLSQKRKQSRVRRAVSVPWSACKPNEQHYSIALNEFAATAKEAWAIGDSMSKDLEPAAKLGVKTIWARYGVIADPNDRNSNTLLRITHWTESEIRSTHRISSFKPDNTVDSFDELRQIVPASVLSLF